MDLNIDDTPVCSPVCLVCKYLNRKSMLSRTCKAFPEGIPDVFLYGKKTHDEPFPGDHGLQFEMLDTDAEDE